MSYLFPAPPLETVYHSWQLCKLGTFFTKSWFCIYPWTWYNLQNEHFVCTLVTYRYCIQIWSICGSAADLLFNPYYLSIMEYRLKMNITNYKKHLIFACDII
jgi:hypothetical protein